MNFRCANYEDRTIFELLGPLVKRPGEVCWIDVGSHSASMESVTKVFYDMGHWGINVEPQEKYYQELCRERPRDINIQCAIGSKPGVGSLFLGDGLSTLREEYAHTDWQSVPVQIRTLADICEEHLRYPEGVTDIQGRYFKYRTPAFLKLDIEGFEREAIEGMDWDKVRPMLLVIEAKAPMREEVETHHEWEPLILAADYTLVKIDRFNRYYWDARKYEELAA